MDFKGTPIKSVEYLMHESLVSVNPLGGGCCFWHAGLNYFVNVLQQMLSRTCNHDCKPNKGWQCSYCGCLHRDDDDDDDEDDIKECEICGYKSHVQDGNAVQDKDP